MNLSKESSMGGEPMSASSKDLLRIVGTVEQAVQMFEAALEILQDAQLTIPAPTLEEVAEIRQGKRPLTQETYLLGSFQRAILAAENVASDLRAIDLETCAKYTSCTSAAWSSMPSSKRSPSACRKARGH